MIDTDSYLWQLCYAGITKTNTVNMWTKPSKFVIFFFFKYQFIHKILYMLMGFITFKNN